MSIKGVNKRIVELNLAHGLKKAFMDGDVESLHKAAQAIINAGYEMEDIQLRPTMRLMIQDALVETGWKPDFTKILEAEKLRENE